MSCIPSRLAIASLTWGVSVSDDCLFSEKNSFSPSDRALGRAHLTGSSGRALGGREGVLLPQKVLIRPFNPLSQSRFVLPAQPVEFADVHEFAGGAVGFGGVGGDGAGVAHYFLHQLGQFEDGEVFAYADVDECFFVVVLHQKEAGVGEVFAEEEFAAGGAAAPDGDAGGVIHFGLVEAADEGRQHVAVFGVVVVADAVEVGGHHADEVGAILVAVGFAEFDAGNLGDGVGLVGGFERAGEQVVFPQGLGGHFGVNAAAAEEHQFLHPVLPGGMNDVGFHQQVVVQELGPVGIVGMDAAYFGGGEEYEGRFFLFEKSVDSGLLAQVEFGRSAVYDVFKACLLQAAEDSAS